MDTDRWVQARLVGRGVVVTGHVAEWEVGACVGPPSDANPARPSVPVFTLRDHPGTLSIRGCHQAKGADASRNSQSGYVWRKVSRCSFQSPGASCFTG